MGLGSEVAEYKVLQDIEGEDHIIAWLTPKQTVYAGIVVVSCILAYVMGRLNILLAMPWIIPIGFFGFLAAPLGKDQPNDIWAAAQLRFYLKNRKRIWDQAGLQELVHITAPKVIEKVYSDGLSQHEVRSRLGALSATIDSRGWAVKNSGLSMQVQSVAPQYSTQNADRLVTSDNLPQEVPITDITAADDILDADNNAVAQRFDEQIRQQTQQHLDSLRQRTQSMSDQPSSQVTPALQSQLPEPPLATFSAQTIAPGQSSSPATITTPTQQATNDSDQELLDKIRHNQELAREATTHTHEHTIKTTEQLAVEKAAEENAPALGAQKPVDKQAPDAILEELSKSDLKISTLAAQAQHATPSDAGEVVISLR